MNTILFSIKNYLKTELRKAGVRNTGEFLIKYPRKHSGQPTIFVKFIER